MSRLFSIVFAAGISGVSVAALAQTAALSESPPVREVLGVVPFGMPADQRFVVCRDGECPERTAKHLPEPAKPPAAVNRMVPLVAPASVQTPAVAALPPQDVAVKADLTPAKVVPEQGIKKPRVKKRAKTARQSQKCAP